MCIVFLSLLMITFYSSSLNCEEVEYQQIIDFEGQINESEIFEWKNYRRDFVNNAKKRVASYDSKIMPIITREWAREGLRSAKCVSALEKSNKARSMFEMVANKSERVYRKLEMGVSYWIGFSIKNVEPKLKTPWELYFQLHNNTPPVAGWGSTHNPQIAIERADNDHYRVIYRYNNSVGKTISTSIQLGRINKTGFTDFVIQVIISNPEPKGVLKVFQRDEGGELVLLADLRDIVIGYYRDNNNDGPVAAFGVYNGYPGVEGRVVYIDSIKITKDPKADLCSVDPELDCIN